MEQPHEEHLAAVKHILRYIAGTIDNGIAFPKRSCKQHQLIGFSDSDLGRGDIDDRKSTTGVIFFLNNMPISWMSQKQKVVALFVL